MSQNDMDDDSIHAKGCLAETSVPDVLVSGPSHKQVHCSVLKDIGQSVLGHALQCY